MLNFIQAQAQLEHLEHDIVCRPEPIQLWQNSNGINMLAGMYHRPEMDGAAFQNFVLLTMLQRQLQTSNAKIQILERSLECGPRVFETATQQFSPCQHECLRAWYEFITNIFKEQLTIKKFIFMKVSPEIAFERIAHRGRREEGAITLHYLTMLEDRYESWRTEMQVQDPSMVMTINANLPNNDIRGEYARVWQTIKSELKGNPNNTSQT